MPRPSWSGYLRLSLVSCPINLAPATSETERIRLHQINPATGNRIRLQPVDAETGEPVERGDLAKGYEYDKGQYVVLQKQELDQIQVSSTKVLDLTTFVDRASVNPLFLSTPYYVYPAAKPAIEAYRVIREAMKKRGRVAIGRIVLTSREHSVMVEPFEDGLLMYTMRAADEVRSAEFNLPQDKLDGEMVAMAETIIDRYQSKWEPTALQDRYQEALRELVEAKLKGVPLPARAEPVQSNVIDLMSALKRSLETKPQSVKAEGAKSEARVDRAARPKAKAKSPDQRQRSMFLPMKGGGKSATAGEREQRPATAAKGRKKAG